jgi:hypothetical protein
MIDKAKKCKKIMVGVYLFIDLYLGDSAKFFIL